MFTGPVGPVEVFFYWPEAVFGNFYWPGAIGLPLASSPAHLYQCQPCLRGMKFDSFIPLSALLVGYSGTLIDNIVTPA